MFVIYRLFNDGHSDQCEVISYCNFNLHSLISNAKHLFQRRQWQATPVLLPRKSHGWRSLVGCIPWGCYESVATERLHFHFSLSLNGEGNGNPLQCSCLENPRDGGAWWAAVYGIAQSRTRLKRLSSSSSKHLFVCLLANLYVFFGEISCMSCLYIFESSPLSVATFANIFSQFKGFLFNLFIVSFAVQNLISLIRSHCLLLLLFLLPWETNLRTHCYNLCQRMFCLCSFLRDL